MVHENSAFRPVVRQHAADGIFEQLAASILRGDLAPSSPLPPERVLGEQFGVSRMILRQAVHRLVDVGLVRVRQGGASVVLDPREATDLRLLGLYYRLDPGGELARSIHRDVIEKQFLQGLSLVDVCARRGTSANKKKLTAMADAFEARTRAQLEAFEEKFWREVARIGKNRIFEMEVGWWYDALADARPQVEPTATLAERVAFYRELARRIADADGATQYYLAVVSPQLDALFAKKKVGS